MCGMCDHTCGAPGVVRTTCEHLPDANILLLRLYGPNSTCWRTICELITQLKHPRSVSGALKKWFFCCRICVQRFLCPRHLEATEAISVVIPFGDGDRGSLARTRVLYLGEASVGRSGSWMWKALQQHASCVSHTAIPCWLTAWE
jgi:hypothetical protein